MATDAPSDELAIRTLVARYVDAVHRRDGDAWSETWVEDGHWSVAGHDCHGRAAIQTFWEQAMAGFSRALLMMHSGTIDLDGAEAAGRWYLSEYTWRHGATTGELTLACYHDRYRRGADGRWRFAERRYQPPYHGAADLSTPLA